MWSLESIRDEWSLLMGSWVGAPVEQGSGTLATGGRGRAGGLRIGCTYPGLNAHVLHSCLEVLSLQCDGTGRWGLWE